MESQNIPIQIAMETGASLPLELLKAVQAEVGRMSTTAGVSVNELQILVKNDTEADDAECEMLQAGWDVAGGNQPSLSETFFLKVEASDSPEGISVVKLCDVQVVDDADSAAHHGDRQRKEASTEECCLLVETDIADDSSNMITLNEESSVALGKEIVEGEMNKESAHSVVCLKSDACATGDRDQSMSDDGTGKAMPVIESTSRPTRVHKPNSKYGEDYVLQKHQVSVSDVSRSNGNTSTKHTKGAMTNLERKPSKVGITVKMIKLDQTSTDHKEMVFLDGCNKMDADIDNETLASDSCEKSESLDTNMSEKKSFLCSTCGKSFRRPYLLKKHEERIHDSNYNYASSRNYTGKKTRTPAACPECQKVLNSAGALKVHLRIHSNDRRFVCPICNLGFTQNGNMQSHIKSVHDRQSSYLCRTCGESFLQQAGLTYHERSHLYSQRLSEFPGVRAVDDNPNTHQVACMFCTEKFQHIIRFLYHIRKHLEESVNLDAESEWQARNVLAKNEDILSQAKVIPCSVCTKIYFNQTELREHMKSHSSTPTYTHKCKFCDKIFSSVSGRNYHQKTHKDQFDFLCKLCEKAFANLGALVRHCRVYHEEKTRSKPPPVPDRYACTECDKTFRSKYNRKVHLRTHAKEKSHACPLCPKTFTDPSNLIAHGKRHHADSPRHLFSSSKRTTYILQTPAPTLSHAENIP